ncbi:MAG: UDP-N-acetylmuramoyl-L-alanyl-D-glutamate--2,6-diaminopimelate ligase [Phycisphaerales bacterium]|nr:UDP-N-acetylmuramoyl-L-alanyl-D-glutamate--2,6-diaminopimelate ligase [Phycisphaerales bacterium]
MRVKIDQLVSAAGLRIVRGAADRELADVTEDSRAASPSCLFVARSGAAADGRKFVADALAKGATAVLSEDESIDVGSATLLAPADSGRPYREVIATTAECFFGSPSSHLTLVGVTGTNGKTTTAHLLQQLMASAGWHCGLIGTVITDDGAAREPATLTTPSSIDLSRLLSRMVANRCSQAVMEVSSHALDQGRAAALHFDVGVFTNLTGDHLDYHGSMEAYAQAKARLFRALPPGGLAVINADDPAADAMIEGCRADIRRTRVTDKSETPAGRDAVARVMALHPTHTSAEFHGPWGAFEIDLPLIGRHNVSNALQATCVAAWCGVSVDCIREALAHCSAPPGRLEPVRHPRSPFTVFVDYAHTDDAIENVLNAARPIVPDGGRLTVVFGCGGDRDRTKRPRMAAAACRLADRVVITSDNPRTEDPEAIVREILAGVPENAAGKTITEVDRRKAIVRCLAEAQANDLIIIAGKGHEDYQIIGRTKHPFDDRLVARATLQARFGEPAQPQEAVP